MADIIIKLINPASSYDLISLAELKALLGISADDTTGDATLQLQITSYSDVIATMCNRVFAKEKVSETWRCLQGNRVFLSHYPIAALSDIVSIECPRGSTITGYEIELHSGKIELYQSTSEPIVVTYTGGYNLPTDAPAALKQAMAMTIREERRHIQLSATAGIRSLSHKESRVMYFDPNVVAAKSASGMSSIVPEAITNLLMHYVRLQV